MEIKIKHIDAEKISSEQFEKNKIHHTTIVYDQIALLTASGFNTSSAIVVNHYSNIAALATNYDNKIRKRKKQLQLVALFGRNITHLDIKIACGGRRIDHDENIVEEWASSIRTLQDLDFSKGWGERDPRLQNRFEELYVALRTSETMRMLDCSKDSKFIAKVLNELI